MIAHKLEGPHATALFFLSFGGMNASPLIKRRVECRAMPKPILRGFVAKVCGIAFKVSQILAHENLSTKSQTLLTDMPG